jgi:hypothetical protein
MTLDAHIAEFQIHVHYLDILDSPLSKDDQLLQFIRSLKHRDLATRIKFDMTMEQAIKAVHTRAASSFDPSIHDPVVPCNHPRHDGKRNGPSLNNLNVNDEEEELLNALEDGEFEYLLDDNEDDDDTLNAIGSGCHGGVRGRDRGGRGGGRGRGAGRGTGRPTMTPQQLEWYKAQSASNVDSLGTSNEIAPTKL